MAGTAREEAERLVATVLAMASQSGIGSPQDKTFSDTAHRVTAGLGAVATTFADALNTLSSTVAAATASPSAPPSPGSPTPSPASSSHAADDSAAHDAAGEPIKGGDPWAAATKNTGPAGRSGRRAGGGSAGGGLLGSFFGGAGNGRSIHYGLANGTIECCVCPICRVIAGMREPGPHTAERLATGAGDLATGLAKVLRTVSAMSGGARPKPARPARPAPPAPDQAWSTATRRDRPAEPPAPPSDATRSTDPWAAASATSAADVASASAAKAASAARAAAAAQAAWAARTAAAKADTATKADTAAGSVPKADTAPATSAAAPTPTPRSVWAAATRSQHGGAKPGPGVTGRDPEPGSGSGVESGRAPGLRTKDGFELEAAAAFADRGGTRVAGGDDVDHDVAGPAGPGDDARAGESRAEDARDAQSGGDSREDDGRAGDQV